MPDNIAVTDLVIRYGRFTAVDGLTLSVGAGEVVGLLGGNGAGKSSTLRALAGVNPPTGGSISIAGHDMADRRQVERARNVIGYCPDVGGLVRNATVREHIALALALHGNTEMWPQAIELTEHFALLDVMDKVTNGFSHGMCRRLSVLLATLTAQEVLILDEPFDGVDPLGADATLDVIGQAKAKGLAVVVSTHLLDLITASCDRVAVMKDGRIIATDTVSTFEGDEGKRRYAQLLRGATP